MKLGILVFGLFLCSFSLLAFSQEQDAEGCSDLSHVGAQSLRINATGELLDHSLRSEEIRNEICVAVFDGFEVGAGKVDVGDGVRHAVPL